MECNLPSNKYFESYENLEVHRLMLDDAPRTEAYRNAILSQKKYFEDKVVMDVGAGTGILSIFCAKAGAKKVYAVEASSLANLIPKVAKENHVENIIQVFHSRVEDVTLPPPDDKVDVIVSEWMGFYLLHEGMLDSVIVARDRHLKPNGKMFPEFVKIWTSPCSLPMFFNFWRDVHGVKMNTIGNEYRQSNASQPKIVKIDPSDLLCDPVCFCSLYLLSVKSSDLDHLSQKVVTHAIRSGKYQGLCITFDCHFPFPIADEESLPVTLSTATDAPETHWKQTAIVFEKELELEEGAPVAWELNMKRNSDNPRSYDLQFEMLDPDVEEHPKPCGCYMTKCIVIKAFLSQLEDNPTSESNSDDEAFNT